MASKTSKWMVVVASGAISVMTGAAAFAAPVTATEGPGQVGRVRSTDDASDLISKVLGKVASNVGTKVAEVKGQARDVVRLAATS
jgi:hypothetical protein